MCEKYRALLHLWEYFIEDNTDSYLVNTPREYRDIFLLCKFFIEVYL